LQFIDVIEILFQLFEVVAKLFYFNTKLYQAEIIAISHMFAIIAPRFPIIAITHSFAIIPTRFPIIAMKLS
jgi:hypothetical protein